MAENIAKDGVWQDVATGEVTTKRPSRAHKLVAPGKPIPADVAELLKPAKKAEAPKKAAPKKADDGD